MRSFAAAMTALLALGACSPTQTAPTAMGVCWRMTAADPQRFAPVASDVANIETCAANLEAIRARLPRQPTLTGAFQGYYVLVRPSGIYIGQRLTGFNIRALVRTEDGRLQRPSLVGACLATTGHGQQSLYHAIEVAPCVQRLIETRCALRAPVLSGRWSDEAVSVTDRQVTLRAGNGAVLQRVGFSGCSVGVE